jgi:hypothetical protein
LRELAILCWSNPVVNAAPEGITDPDWLYRDELRKFKRFKRGATLAGQFMERLATERPDLFAHWRLGMTGTFV